VIVLDGSQGEGGGQILRTSVSLAAALGRSVRVTGIRARRQRPGLRPQHLTALRATAAICRADLTGADIGSMDITFRPGAIRSGSYRFDIGTAGSAVLVLQTVLPALLLAEGDSDVTVTGGTHNPLAPCFEYFRDVFGVLASASNLQMYVEMVRPGFYPGGGGEIRMQVRGVGSVDNVEPIVLTDRGELRRIEGLSAASESLPAHIIERQASRASRLLAEARHPVSFERAAWETDSPGTVVFLRAVFAKAIAGSFALGARGKPAERVADEAVEELLAFIDSPGAVDRHAGDQLLTILALCPHESRYVTQRLTSHLRTNADVVTQVTGRGIDVEPGEAESARVTVRGA